MAVIAENRANKRSTWQVTPTDVAYPSEKLVKDTLNTKVKLTKMPDGATAVYSQDFLNGVDGWGGYVNVASVQNYANDAMLITPTNPASNYYITRTIFGFTGKRLLIRARVAGGTTYIAVYPTILGSPKKQIFGQLNARNSVFSIDIPVWAGGDSSLLCFEIGPSESTYIDWIWIGDYSYLGNSLATEASRIANQLGDTAGVGTKASGTCTSNGTNVTAGKKYTINGKAYTFIATLTGAEGEVLIGANANESIRNLSYAIWKRPTNNYGEAEPLFSVAAAHPNATATNPSPYNYVLITARNAGILGNSITMTTDEPTFTLSGSTLSGGTDDVGAKVITQLESSYKGTPKFNGISFPATQVPSADPNTLDDYEEGTWTPGVYASTSGAGTPATLSEALGKYNKIGNLVTLRFAITFSSVLALSGSIEISGLPFSGVSEGNLRGIGAFYVVTGVTVLPDYWMTIGTVSNTATVLQINGTNSINITASNLTNDAVMRGMLVYNA